MLSLPARTGSHNIAPRQRPAGPNWLDYFSLADALHSVAAHIAALPSSTSTPERHTAKSYEMGLRYFLAWYNEALPGPALVQEYIAHLKMRGLKSSTIATRYLAPLRLLIGKLHEQHIPVTGREREFVADCKEQMSLALKVKSPKAEQTSNVAPLWRADHVRLSLQEVNAVLRRINRRTLSGLRDYALLRIAFESALRIAELQRLTLDSFRAEDNVVLITVRGKRNNIDSVSITPDCYAAVNAYVDAWNADLDDDDPRVIDRHVALWQPMIHGNNYPLLGVNRYNPRRGMSIQSIRDVIARRTVDALGEDRRLAAHDTRRTAAALAYESGMGIAEIQKLLRHKSAATTLLYVGERPDYAGRTLGLRIKIG